MAGWDDMRNAELYDRFARTHNLYRATSRDLVELAGLDDAHSVIDLACGTGVTTEAILQRLGPDAEVVALDASEAMLAVARRSVTDPRVRWVPSPAVDVDRHVRDADVIVCNSAIWQLDMEPALAAAGRALRTGGRLAFNIGRQFLMLPLKPEELRPDKPTFMQLVQAVAVLHHDFAPAHPAASRGRPLTPDAVEAMIERAGLVLSDTRTFEYANPPEEQLAWLSVPVFGDNLLPGLPHEVQLEVLRKAYERVDTSRVQTNLWMAFVASKPGARCASYR